MHEHFENIGKFTMHAMKTSLHVQIYHAEFHHVDIERIEVCEIKPWGSNTFSNIIFLLQKL